MIIPLYPSGIIESYPFISDVTKYLSDPNKTLDNLLKIDKYLDTLNYIPSGIIYNSKKNNKYNVIGFIINDSIICKTTPKLCDEKTVKQFGAKCKIKNFKIVNKSLDNKIDKILLDKNIVIDERIRDNNRRKFENENYQLFKFELSNYLKNNEKVREQIKEIVEKKNIKDLQKKNLLNGVLNKLKFYETNEKKINIDNYQISNIRNLCEINEKEDCNQNQHCIYKNNKCKFNLTKKI